MTKKNLNKSREEKKYTRLHYQKKATLTEGGFEELAKKEIQDMTEEEKTQFKVYLFRQTDETEDQFDKLKKMIDLKRDELKGMIN